MKPFDLFKRLNTAKTRHEFVKILKANRVKSLQELTYHSNPASTVKTKAPH